MRAVRVALLALVSGSIVAAAACSGSKSGGSGSPTPTGTDTPITGSVTALTAAGAELVDNSTDTVGSTFAISVTANGQNYTDSGTWNCYGPVSTSGAGNSYDLFFTSGTMISSFDINIPAANWTSSAAVSLSIAGPVTGYLSIAGGSSINMTGGSITVTSAPVVENSAHNCAFSLTTPLTFDSTM